MILIADDHAIFRSGLRLTLERISSQAKIQEAGSLSGLFALLSEIDEADIDVVILDLLMPGMDGWSGITKTRKRLRTTPILVLSASEDADDVLQALAAGASGYISKSSSTDRLYESIRIVQAGGVVVPREVLAGVSDIARPGLPAAPVEDPALRSRLLTPRQTEVLHLVVAGHANKDIAYRLSMNEGTVKAHVSAIMRQLNVRNRVQIIRAAEAAGLI